MTLDVGNIQQEVQKLKEHLRHLEALLVQTDVTAEIAKIMKDAKAEIESYEESLGQQPGTIYQESTLARTTAVLTKFVVLLNCEIKKLGMPQVFPGMDGDIDIHWKIPIFELLLTVPANPSEPIYYYMDNFAKIKTKGTIPDEKLDTLALMIHGYL